MINDNPFRPGSSKAEAYDAWLSGGEAAARARNASLPKPLAENTLRTQFSLWRNGRVGLPKQRLADATKILRDTAIRCAGAARIPGRAELYRLPSGQTAKLRTNMKRGLMAKNNGLQTHPVDAVLISIPNVARSLDSGIAVYLVPIGVALTALKQGREAWLASSANGNPDIDLDVINFDEVSGWVEACCNFADKWAQYRLPDIAAPATPAPVIKLVEYRGCRVISDQEILSAPTADGIVTMLRFGVRFEEPEPTNEAFMRGAAERARTSHGADIRHDTAEHFIHDLHDAGLIELIKREYVMEAA